MGEISHIRPRSVDNLNIPDALGAGVPLARSRPEVFVSKLITIWFACSFAATATPAVAQPVSADSPQVVWRISAGRDAAGLRDIARTGIPVDASPVQWRGTGLGLFAQHTRERGRWRQEYSAAFTRATEFHYEVGDISTPRPSDDRFTRADVLYALHRRLFSDVGFEASHWQQGCGWVWVAPAWRGTCPST